MLASRAMWNPRAISVSEHPSPSRPAKGEPRPWRVGGGVGSAAWWLPGPLRASLPAAPPSCATLPLPFCGSTTHAIYRVRNQPGTSAHDRKGIDFKMRSLRRDEFLVQGNHRVVLFIDVEVLDQPLFDKVSKDPAVIDDLLDVIRRDERNTIFCQHSAPAGVVSHFERFKGSPLRLQNRTPAPGRKTPRGR